MTIGVAEAWFVATSVMYILPVRKRDKRTRLIMLFTVTVNVLTLLISLNTLSKDKLGSPLILVKSWMFIRSLGWYSQACCCISAETWKCDSFVGLFQSVCRIHRLTKTRPEANTWQKMKLSGYRKKKNNSELHNTLTCAERIQREMIKVHSVVLNVLVLLSSIMSLLLWKF